jgi:molybdopterin adenylyltransferase
MRAAIITISTSKAAGGAVDESGERLVELAGGLRTRVVGRDVVPDDRRRIAERLRHWADMGACDLVLTTGGTGFAPSDVAPEATRDVIDKEAPGIQEALRAASREHTRFWMLSRGVAGIRGTTLIVNFPGSPRSIVETGAVVADVLPHALDLLAGGRGGH